MTPNLPAAEVIARELLERHLGRPPFPPLVEAIAAALMAERHRANEKFTAHTKAVQTFLGELGEIFSLDLTDEAPVKEACDMIVKFATAERQHMADLVAERDSARDAALAEMAEWCRTQASMLGAVDGYDYRSGEECGLTSAALHAESLKTIALRGEPENARDVFDDAARMLLRAGDTSDWDLVDDVRVLLDKAWDGDYLSEKSSPERAAVGEVSIDPARIDTSSQSVDAANTSNPTLDELRERVVAEACTLESYRGWIADGVPIPIGVVKRIFAAVQALQAAQAKEGG